MHVVKTLFLLRSPVIHENCHHPDLHAQSVDHVHHSAAPLVLHGGHEQRPGVTHRRRSQHRCVSLLSSLSVFLCLRVDEAMEINFF